MAFKVSLPLNTSIPDAHLSPGTKLNTIIPLESTPGVPVRQLGLIGNVDSYGRQTPELGAAINTDVQHPIIVPSGFEDNKPEVVQLIRNPDGTQSVIEEWQIYNATDHAHPIHIHQTSFQIVSRQNFTYTKANDPTTGVPFIVVTGLIGKPTGPDANEAGWKDTVRADPGEVTTIVMKFDLPGNYVWHCHILEHEDHDMLHELVILPAPPKNPTGSTISAAASSSVVSTMITAAPNVQTGASNSSATDATISGLNGQIAPLLSSTDGEDAIDPLAVDILTLSRKKRR